jgi:hypothetical protein
VSDTSTALAARASGGFSLRPTTFAEATQFAKVIAASDLAPKDYKGKPENCLIAVQMGAELGLAPMQAIQNIAVINGRPSLFGDAVLAVCQSSPDFEDIVESCDGQVATCTVRRRGRSPVTHSFSQDDAKKAGLWGKQGPWQQYPTRMLQMRARGFALRDAYADRLKGIEVAEEAIDITPVAPPPSEPRRLSETAPPSPQADASAPASSASHPDAAPSAPAAASAPSVSTGTQLTNGVRIADTKVAVDPKNPKQKTYEVYAKKANAVVCFLTHDKALYDEAASCEGTDHLFTISYTRGRHRDAPALIMTGITLEERDDATPTPEQGTLPTEGA